ncbi:MAG: hypothetical protein WAK93_09095 [Solirubrobacteraceae bacterium]
MRVTRFLVPGLALLALAAATPAAAVGKSTSGTVTPDGAGGAGLGAPIEAPSTIAHPTVTGARAKVIHGVAYAPSYAPIQVKKAIWAGDQIRTKPYIYGGGHGTWKDAGYDCSGSVSYVLHAAGLLKTSMDSTDFESWGRSGKGQWITVYTNAGHAFVQIAGIRFDTSAEDDPNPPPGTGPRWRPVMHRAPGFETRHPASL